MISPIAQRVLPSLQAKTNDVLRQKARDLEQVFLTEMLGHTGLGKSRDSFGGGIGEDQFSSFLRQEQASIMEKKGGIGLAEALFKAMSVTKNAG